MTNNTILVLPGDGVGPEVIKEALKVLQVVNECSAVDFSYEMELFGGCSIDAHGVPIADAVLGKAQADIVLAGAVGGAEWRDPPLPAKKPPNPKGNATIPYKNTNDEPVYEEASARSHAKPVSSNCASPSTHTQSSAPAASPQSPSAISASSGARPPKFPPSTSCLREKTAAASFGSKIEEKDVASDIWAYSRVEVERIARVAISLSRTQDPLLSVISTEKANVIASGRLWRRVVGETFASDAPGVKLGHQLADSAAMLMMTDILAFNGILLADNTFGDILSGEALVIRGSLGLLPSEPLSRVPSANIRVKGFYELVHGSASKIAVRGISNPVATTLLVEMMLRYSLYLHRDADAVDNAVRKVLCVKALGGLETRTGDLGSSNSTNEVGNAVAKVLKEILLKEA